MFAYTISGTWGDLEQPWTATPGSFVYQTPGKGHTLDEDGNGNDLFDVRDYLTLCREHDERVGIGAEYVDTLIR
ncbi:MAG: putative 2,4-dihydroxyacetophenone dioxygenase [Modestobacter sp.]|nr:putative 2,4-dihydroxyacetophenone dioxygenase [Modestobacter sp.]